MTGPALIRLDDVHLTLGGREVLRGVTLDVTPGTRLAVLGANGAGKSSLLRVLRGDAWPSAGRRAYHLGATPRESPIGARERIALVAPETQDRVQRLAWPMSGAELVASGAEFTDLPPRPLPDELRDRAIASLAAIGAERLAARDARAMSKGELRQVLLARALVANPRVLLLDEFFAGVDAASRARLRDVVARVTVPLVYTTHRADELAPDTTHVLELRHGRVARLEPFRPAPAAASGGAPARRAAGRTAPGGVLVEVVNATVHLDSPDPDEFGERGARPVLHAVNWTLRRGEHWAVLGANGAGKSTFAKLIAGELHPAVGGEVRRAGLDALAPVWAVRGRVGLVSAEVQLRHRADATGFVASATGRTIVASGITGSIGVADGLTGAEWARVDALLERFALEHLAVRNAFELSHGELKRLLIARALAPNPDVLVLDEPFDYLDAASRDALFRAVREVAAGGVSVVVIAHREDDVPAEVTHALVLSSGRVALAGGVASVLEQHPLA